MNYKVLKGRKTFFKFLSVMLAIALSFAAVPVNNTVKAASGESQTSLGAPSYDSSLGDVNISTSNGFSMTAVPNEGCYFRGWFKNGIEVSREATFNDATVDTAHLYKAEFYDVNLISDSGFECYENGTNLKEISGENKLYNKLYNDETWGKAFVTDSQKYSGNNSLCIASRSNCSYRYLNNLNKNTQYKLSFYYFFLAEENYLSQVFIYDSSSTVEFYYNTSVETFAYKSFTSETGACKNGEWNKCELTFYTDETTDFVFGFIYKATQENPNIYIDEFRLVEAPLASPDYANKNFEDNNKNGYYIADARYRYLHFRTHKWDSTSENYERFGERSLEMRNANNNSYTFIASQPFFVKKGYTYTYSFDVDLSDYPTYNPDGSSSVASIDYGISTDKYGGNFDTNLLTAENSTITVSDLDSNWSSTVTKSGLTYCAFRTMGGSDMTRFNITITFVAPEYQELYFVARPNNANVTSDVSSGHGGAVEADYSVVYFDNFNLNETNTGSIDDDIAWLAAEYVGVAVRTEGAQGIRYKTSIDKRLLCDDYYGVKAIEYGTVAVRTAYLNGTGDSLKIDTNYNYNGKTVKSVKGVAYSLADGINKTFTESQNSIEFTGVLINIKENFYTSDYTVRSYFKYINSTGETKTVYSPVTNTSVYNVAKYAYNNKNGNGEFVESEATRTLLYNSVLNKSTENKITVNNDGENIIQNNFGGISTTIYHCFTFMDDTYNRTYTEDMAAIEMDRLVYSGITTVRTIFSSTFAWAKDNSGWDWESDDMQAVYKWAKMLQDRGIEVALNTGWGVSDHISGNASSIPAVEYLRQTSGTGYTGDIYGETVGMDFTGMTDEEIRFATVSRRYAEWMSQALQAMRKHGIYNVKYLYVFTEPSLKVDVDDDVFDEYMTMALDLHNELTNDGIRKTVKLIGPNQHFASSFKWDWSLLNYYLNLCKQDYNKYNPVFDIISMHSYASTQWETIENSTFYHDHSETFYKKVKELADSYGNTKEVWSDEFFAYSRINGLWYNNNGVQLTQVAACMTAIMNNGINRTLSWQIFDQYWRNQNNSSEEFQNGFHIVGAAPSFASLGSYVGSYVPRKNYYGLGLLGKQLGSEDGTVYSTKVENTTNGGLYTSAVLRKDGKLVVLVVNTTDKPMNITYEFKTAVNENFERYVYNPNEIVPTADATPIGVDTVIKNVGTTFYDVVSAYSFNFYVTENSVSGDDVEMPID